MVPNFVTCSAETTWQPGLGDVTKNVVNLLVFQNMIHGLSQCLCELSSDGKFLFADTDGKT